MEKTRGFWIRCRGILAEIPDKQVEIWSSADRSWLVW